MFDLTFESARGLNLAEWEVWTEALLLRRGVQIFFRGDSNSFWL